MFKVLMIYRKCNPRFFSIEAVFDRIRMNLPSIASEIIVLPKYGFSIYNLFFLLKARWRNGKALFHLTGDAHYTVAVLPRKRSVLTIHDCVFLSHYQGPKKWLVKFMMLTFPVKYVKYITTISEKTKQEIILETKCRADKIIVIANPVSPVFYFQEKQFNQVCPVLLFVGVTANKNLERVCLAIRELPCLLKVIGELSEEQNDLIKRHGISFQSLHSISDIDMADEYSEADIIIFPSLYEGFGLPIIEGFKSGRVVVTSNISPMKDIAEGGAFLVDPFDVNSIRNGLLLAIHDKEQREAKIRNGLDIVRKYEPAVIAHQYEELYRKIDQ